MTAHTVQRVAQPKARRVRLHSEFGVPTSDDGELLVRSAAAFTRYVDGTGAPSAALAGAWLRTGDRAMSLPSGELALLGRTQSLVTTECGTRVDTAQLVDKIRQTLGDSEIAFQHCADKPNAEAPLCLAFLLGEHWAPEPVTVSSSSP